MNVVFLTLSDISSISERGIYTDLMRCFAKNGHQIFMVSPAERRSGKETELIRLPNCTVLKVKTGNIQKTNLLEKGISTVLLETQMIAAIKKYLSDVKFDLILYSTPPVTLVGAVSFLKKRDNAISYLLLKDIFPANAVDIGMMNKNGWKGILYWYFRRKEKQLYAISDMIGCMSQANCDYVVRNNPEVKPEKVEVCPNSVEPVDMSVEDKRALRKKYAIPEDRTVFVYGGNLGKPQGIPFLIECLESQRNNQSVFFLIVGDGTEYKKLEEFVKTSNQPNVKLISRLPKEDYDRMVGSCDVGMIFLDHRFTIPNFPSRLLSYMQAKLPVMAVTDPNTDIGRIAAEGGFGWWCESDDVKAFGKYVEHACQADLKRMGENAWQYLNDHYTADQGYQIIIKHL